MQVIVRASSVGSSFTADVYLAVAVSLKTSSNPITLIQGDIWARKLRGRIIMLTFRKE